MDDFYDHHATGRLYFCDRPYTEADIRNHPEAYARYLDLKKTEAAVAASRRNLRLRTH